MVVLNVAVTDDAAFRDTVQVAAVPLQAPDHLQTWSRMRQSRSA